MFINLFLFIFLQAQVLAIDALPDALVALALVVLQVEFLFSKKKH